MQARLYGLKNCDTCRKALKAVPELTLVDVRGEGVPAALLSKAFEQFGESLVNTRSTTWRGLGAQEHDAPRLELLKAHPALMKRPLIEVSDQLFLSWNKEVEAEVKALL